MLTPQEIRDKSFVKAVFGGYDMSEVDEFLDQLSEDYIALYKENAVLKSKMKVLVNKIEEYKKSEETISTAMLSAQKTANDIIDDAKLKSLEIVKNAEAIAIEKTIGIQKDIKNEERRLLLSKKTTADFIDEIKKLIKKQVEILSSIPNLEFEIENRIEDSAEPVIDAAEEIENSVQKILSAENDTIDEADQIPEIPEDKSEKEDINMEDLDAEDGGTEYNAVNTDEDLTPKPKFNFKNLQFGKEYEVK